MRGTSHYVYRPHHVNPLSLQTQIISKKPEILRKPAESGDTPYVNDNYVAG